MERCRVCHKPVKESWMETCGVVCSKKLGALRKRPDWPAESDLCDELHSVFSYDECSCLL